MAGSFFDPFNKSLDAAAKVFGEEWCIEGAGFPAINITTLAEKDRAAMGARLKDVSLTVDVDAGIFAFSGAKDGTIITVRGTRLRIAEIQRDGTKAVRLICGPAGVSVR